MISKRASNDNSTLLEQMVKAAADAAPKENNDFRDCVIKIAQKAPATLEQSLRDLIRDQKMRKVSQQPGVLEGPDAGLDDTGGIDLGGPEAPIDGLGEDDAAADAIWNALVALKGSPEEAQVFVDQKMANPEPGLGEDLPPVGEPDPMAAPMESAPMESAPMQAAPGAMPAPMPM